MVTSSRSHPRFLPTLTEIVHVPVQVPEPEPEPLEDGSALETARREAFAERIGAQLHAALDRRMQDAVADAMLEQVDVIGDRLRQQMDDMVRDSLDTITDRLRAELNAMVREAVQAVLLDDALPAAETPPASKAEPSL